MPRFEAHQPTPPSSFPPASGSSFVTCHSSKLTNPFLPLPPLQLVSPRLCRAAFQSSPTSSSPFLDWGESVLMCSFPVFDVRPPAPPASLPPVGQSWFVTFRTSNPPSLLLLPSSW